MRKELSKFVKDHSFDAITSLYCKGMGVRTSLATPKVDISSSSPSQGKARERKGRERKRKGRHMGTEGDEGGEGDKGGRGKQRGTRGRKQETGRDKGRAKEERKKGGRRDALRVHHIVHSFQSISFTTTSGLLFPRIPGSPSASNRPAGTPKSIKVSITFSARESATS